MSNHDPRPGSSGDGHDAQYDAVDELFARERALLTDLPGDELHWQRIVHAARGQRRTHRLRYAGAAAAVALLAGGVAWAATGGPGGRTSPAATRPAGGTVSAGPTTPAPGTATPTTPPSTGPAAGLPGYGSPVPRDFTVLSLSNVGHGTLFAMGSGSCGASRGACPVLVRSTDDGRTWSTVHAFPDQVVPSASHRVATVQPGSVLSQARFANARVGWVFGGAAFATRDGGRTWAAYPHAGDAVVALETDGERVAVVSGQRCQPVTCSGTITLGVDSVSQPHGVAGGGASTDLGQDWSDPVVAIVAGRPVISAHTTSGGVLLGEWGHEGLSPTSFGPVCQGGGLDTLTADASAQPGFVGLCVTQGAAGTLGYAVSTSPDGASWSPVSVDALTLVNAGHLSLAAADHRDFLAVSGGSPDVHGSMRVSHDGGRTWATPRGAPPLPEWGWRWVGAPGGPTFYAVAADGARYWVSDDLGEHWRAVAIR